MNEHEICITSEVTLLDEQEVFALIAACAKETLEQEGIEFDAQIDVTIVDDGAIREANAEFRGKDAVTDVLSFPMYEFENGEAQEELYEESESGCVLLGDMLLNYARACEQAEEFGHSPARECGFLTVHSCLHLLGYDHERGEEEQRLMRTHEEAVLTKLGLTRG